MNIAVLEPDMNFYLINSVYDNDNENDNDGNSKEEKQEVSQSKKKRIEHKTKLPQDIITAIGEKGSYKQFKYSLYQ